MVARYLNKTPLQVVWPGAGLPRSALIGKGERKSSHRNTGGIHTPMRREEADDTANRGFEIFDKRTLADPFDYFHAVGGDLGNFAIFAGRDGGRIISFLPARAEKLRLEVVKDGGVQSPVLDFAELMVLGEVGASRELQAWRDIR